MEPAQKEGDTVMEGSMPSWAFIIIVCNQKCETMNLNILKLIFLAIKTISTTLSVSIMKSLLRSASKCLLLPRSQTEHLKSWRDLP